MRVRWWLSRWWVCCCKLAVQLHLKKCPHLCRCAQQYEDCDSCTKSGKKWCNTGTTCLLFWSLSTNRYCMQVLVETASFPISSVDFQAPCQWLPRQGMLSVASLFVADLHTCVSLQLWRSCVPELSRLRWRQARMVCERYSFNFFRVQSAVFVWL